MKKIWTKNMKIVHDDKERHINFDKRISWKSFFTICFSWINKRRESMIAFWYTIHETNHKHMIHEDKKSMKHYWSWTTHEHEHEHNFDHNQNHIRNHDMKYEISETSDVDREYCNETDSVSRYDDSVKHSSWISRSRLTREIRRINIDKKSQANQNW